ncbi:MAG: hypothetical protein ACREL6_06880 [Gemmatimonadales bacterium]
MDNHEEIYGKDRADRLRALLRELRDRIERLDGDDALLGHVPELMRLLGEARSELFHYEVRSTYDTPEIAENRRIVDEARQSGFTPQNDEPEEDDPWRQAPDE